MSKSKAFNMVDGGGGGIRLENIAVTAPPAKTAYYAGESFDPTGMVVLATYSNGATLAVGGYTVSPQVLTAGAESVTITYAEAGVTRSATLAVSVTRRSVTIPTYNGSLTYDGTEQTPTFTDDPGDLATKGGDTSATNAGTNYATTFALNDTSLYEWSDGSTGVKRVGWNIAKKAPTISASPGSVALGPSALTADCAITTDSDGALSVGTSASSVATATISGKTVTVKHVNKTSGTAKITVSQAASTNYKAASVEISVTAKFVTIYGVEWDGTSTTKWTRTDAAAGFTDPVPYVAGASSYGSPFDSLQPWAGMKRVTDSEAGELVSIPKYWFKWTRSGATMKLQVTPDRDQTDNSWHVSPAHADRGDGHGERDVVYVGRYHCAAGTYKSAAGVSPQVNMTRAAARSAIANLGAKIWQYDFAMYWTIRMLYLVEFADWNSQAAIGYGCGNNKGVQAMGYTDSMPYHTGTTQSSRDTYGLGTQYRYIEGLWDNCYDWCDGLYFGGSSALNYYCIKNPSDFSDSSGGTNMGPRGTGGRISAWTNPTASGFEYALYPSAFNGSETYTTYICDYCSYSSSGRTLYTGGRYAQDQGGGAFRIGDGKASDATASIGSRLQKLP